MRWGARPVLSGSLSWRRQKWGTASLAPAGPAPPSSRGPQTRRSVQDSWGGSAGRGCMGEGAFSSQGSRSLGLWGGAGSSHRCCRLGRGHRKAVGTGSLAHSASLGSRDSGRGFRGPGLSQEGTQSRGARRPCSAPERPLTGEGRGPRFPQGPGGHRAMRQTPDASPSLGLPVCEMGSHRPLRGAALCGEVPTQGVSVTSSLSERPSGGRWGQVWLSGGGVGTPLNKRRS